VAGHVFVFAVATETSHARDDQTRVVFLEDFGWGETEAFEDAWTEWVD
jgi:hypothetical protein